MALRLELLKKQYVGPDGSAVPVIDVPGFSLGDNEQVALVGGSGTGKTTLLHLIAGILTPDSGRILFTLDEGGTTPKSQQTAEVSIEAASATADAMKPGASPTVLEYRAAPTATSQMPAMDNGIDIAAMSEGQRDVFRGRNLGYIFQSHHLLPGFTALENVLLGMSFTNRAADPAWAKHLLQEVGLADRLHYKPAKLSVGQQQRVAVARALANRPKLVLADEPTGALDPKTAQQVLALVRKLCDEVKASLLLVSHDPAIVEQLPRRVLLAELNRASMV